MACRVALFGKFKSSGVVLLDGNIPPEIEQINKMPRILLARNKMDKFYSSIRWKNNVKRLLNSDIESYICEFDGGQRLLQRYRRILIYYG